MDSKMWCVYTVEYYLAVNKNEIMNFADKSMELEKITLSEIIQTEKEECQMFSYWRFLTANPQR